MRSNVARFGGSSFCVVGSPPCTPFSQLQGLNKARRDPEIVRKDHGASRGGRGGGQGSIRVRKTEAVPGETDKNSIFLQEHLTQYSKSLLKEAKETFKDDFQYPGYVKDGEVRVKRTVADRPQVIRSRADINRIKNTDNHA